MSNLLEESDIEVGERYRGAVPLKLSSTITSQIKFDDRYVDWISNENDMLRYVSTNDAKSHIATMEAFLDWAGRKLKEEETSIVTTSQ